MRCDIEALIEVCEAEATYAVKEARIGPGPFVTWHVCEPHVSLAVSIVTDPHGDGLDPRQATVRRL